MEEVKRGPLDFQFHAPVSVWLEKSAPKGRQRRIGGLISTDNRDRQGEIVLQKGLDFSQFLSTGWFNDNHSKDTDSGVGYPDKDKLRYVKKGEMLPDGRNSPGNGHWAEGFLLEGDGNDRCDKIWKRALSLEKAGNDRRLGFSIEGGIQKRAGPNNKTIVKAAIRNVAITNCPVNIDTQMEAFVKSFVAVEESETPEELWKALGMGTAAGGPLVQPAGVQTGETAGQVLATESLETDKKPKLAQKSVEIEIEVEGDDDEENGDDKTAKKSLTPATAWEMVKSKFPTVTAKQVGQLVELAQRLKAKSRL